MAPVSSHPAWELAPPRGMSCADGTLMSSKLGTYKTVEARFLPGFKAKSLKRFELFHLRWEAVPWNTVISRSSVFPCRERGSDSGPASLRSHAPDWTLRIPWSKRTGGGCVLVAETSGVIRWVMLDLRVSTWPAATDHAAVGT